MNTAKTIPLLLACAFFLSMPAKGQQTPATTAGQQETKTAARQMNLDSLKAVAKSKSAPTKKNEIPEVPMTAARITFDYTHFDFGNVPPGDKVTHDFPVKNTGPDTLIITKIKPG